MTLIPANLRDAVVRRAGHRCEYCRLAQESQVATFPVDHVVPVSLGGLSELINLALACPRCNARKWKHVEAADSVTGQLTPLYNPRIHPWIEHFRWSPTDPAVIEAISAIGRVTLVVLDLNSREHLTIRALLGTLALHPPPEDSAV